MKREYVFLGVVLIIGSTYVIEYLADLRYPVNELTLTGLKGLNLGENQTYSFIRGLERVGNHTYVVSKVPGGGYRMQAWTWVSTEEGSVELASSFVFGPNHTPRSYFLAIEEEGEYSFVNVSFEGGMVNSEVLFQGDVVSLSEEFPSGSFLAENNMPGFWGILLGSAELERGQRYSALVYIPQGGKMFKLQFYVSPNLQTINVGGEDLTCMVVQESTLDLKFYFNEGRMVQMRNDDQDLVFNLLPS